jgi:hypothetical protein
MKAKPIHNLKCDCQIWPTQTAFNVQECYGIWFSFFQRVFGSQYSYNTKDRQAFINNFDVATKHIFQ